MFTEFHLGFITGFVVAVVLGYLVNQMRLALKQARGARKPQTVTQTTSKTPRQVVNESFWGTIRFLLFTAGLALFLVFLYLIAVQFRLI